MLSAKDKPLVTVGVVVYNEGRFIRETIESLLAQNYEYLEIVICDNCSTDNSADICRAAAETDERIRYIRHDENIGAPANSIFALGEARGDYFIWAAGHDIWAPDLIGKCVDALEQNPGAAIAYGTSTWIDIEGNELQKESGWYDTRGLDPMLRFFFAFWGNAHPILGVIRTRYLRAIPRIFTCIGADQILLTDLALRGDFIHVRDTSWCRRQPRTEESYAEKLKRYKSGEFGMAGSWIDRKLPLLRLPVEQSRSVLRSDLGWIRKLAVLMALFPAFLVRYFAGRAQ
jgi:glycosyltransferase involved in cell wall biosynthesis